MQHVLYIVIIRPYSGFVNISKKELAKGESP